MKKIVIAGSATDQSSSKQWVQYWRDAGQEVIGYPVKIDPSNFLAEYPAVYRNFFIRLLKADTLFVMNEDKKGIKGYIGAETFAEMGYVVANNQLGSSNVEIVLLKMPESGVQCVDEVVLWLKLGWIRMHSIN